jgi:hypothetical protein
MIDAEQAVKQVWAELARLGFTPRDADGSDYQRGDDNSLRFKVGTSYGEVAIQVFRGKNPGGVLRIISEETLEYTLATLGNMVADQVRSEA